MTDISEIIARWDANEGKPYKGSLIDWSAFETDPQNIGCMCAQGQVLHLVGGWSPERLHYTKQYEADKATAKLLNISISHSILLRSINDKADGAPSIVLTDPDKILGDQAKIVLAFWLHLDRMTKKQWESVWVAARDAATDAAWEADRDAAWVAAWDAATDAAWEAARDAAWVAARDAGRHRSDPLAAAVLAPAASNEIQGARILREKAQNFYFLPMFGFGDPESIPALPVDYVNRIMNNITYF